MTRRHAFYAVFFSVCAVAVLALFAAALGSLNSFQGRYESLWEDHTALVQRWQVVVERCTRGAAGEATCEPGTFTTTTLPTRVSSTSTVIGAKP